MALSANLFLRQSQSLVMTPQLMQSIQLLQMTHLELTHFISQEIEKNPLLELVPDDDDFIGEPHRSSDDTASDTGVGEGTEGEGGQLASDWYEPGQDNTLSERLDTNFDTSFADEGGATSADTPELLGQWKSIHGSAAPGGDAYDLDDFVAGRVSLQDHLKEQIPFAVHGAGDRLLAMALLDQIDDTGYLSGDFREIAERFGTGVEHVENILFQLQSLDPPGVFARSLSECLAIQLRLRDRLDPAMAVLIDNLELLAKRDFATLKKLCRVDEEDLIDMLAEIRKLNPKPGNCFEPAISESVVPDIIIRPNSGGQWVVELNPDVLPRVLVNQNYLTVVARKSESDQSFLSECLQNANWLTRSLDQRAKTIAKVAAEIVRQQDAFLRHGVEHLRPLNLKAVADAIKMHESTVSRVTSNKYMLTPRGLFELKYFFSVSIASAEGGETHSAESVRHRIRALIAQETAEDVLSDDDIVHSLKRDGVDLARRTVAKYREAMNIPSSVQRRREKRALSKVSAG